MENSSHSTDTVKNYIFEKETNLYTGEYFRISKKKYHLEHDRNKFIEWECVYRNNLADFKKIYGSEIIPIIKNSNSDFNIENFSILLIENYRYPVDKKILEFPAGIIDNHEYGILENLHSQIHLAKDGEEKKNLIERFDEVMREMIITSASRELKEETGYSGTFKSFFTLPKKNPIKIFENLFYDQWKGLENGALSIFEIDKSSKENYTPKQSLDECEIIKVHEVKLSELLDFITEKIESENYGCSMHLYTFAMGLEFSNVLKSIYKN
jgi:8-oxo-dGTP pyrophosphatase MutT (NUDIX family)